MHAAISVPSFSIWGRTSGQSEWNRMTREEKLGCTEASQEVFSVGSTPALVGVSLLLFLVDETTFSHFEGQPTVA